MGVFVKICGLCSRADVEGVAALRPDALGFVFWEGSARRVTARDVADWTRDLPEGLRKVGVFVDHDIAEVLSIVETASLDVVQLHGGEPPEMCDDIPVDVWKALHLDRDGARDLSGYRVDAFLVDSYSTESPGGTGRQCDWDAARKFVETCGARVLLAGGLTPENVEEGIRRDGSRAPLALLFDLRQIAATARAAPPV